MKMRLLVLALVTSVTVLSLSNTAIFGEGEKTPDAPAGMSPEDMAAAMEACAAAQKMGEPHERLKHFVGEWNTVTKVWMMPGMDPMTSTGTSKITSVLDGRFIQEELKSSMMGQPYNGIGMQGYNTVHNVYEATWASSVDNHIYTMRGTAQPDKDGKFTVFNFYGEMDEPMMNMIGRMINYRTTILSKDKHRFEIFDLAAGPDYKVIEIEYTRK